VSPRAASRTQRSVFYPKQNSHDTSCPNRARAHTLKGVGIAAPSAEHAKTHPSRIWRSRWNPCF